MATAKLHGTEVPEGGDEEKRRPSSRSRCIAPLRNLSSGKCIRGKSARALGFLLCMVQSIVRPGVRCIKKYVLKRPHGRYKYGGRDVLYNKISSY